jgi:hypothetical protein
LRAFLRLAICTRQATRRVPFDAFSTLVTIPE